MKSSESNDPYELIPLVEYKTEKDQGGQTYQLVAGHSGKLQNSKSRQLGDYYTLSKKGITQYVKEEPVEYTPLADWLVERSFYREICVKSFFQNFKRWKQLRMWRRNILQKKREEIKQTL